MYLYYQNCFWYEYLCLFWIHEYPLAWKGHGPVCGVWVFREANKVQVESIRCALWFQVSVGRMCGSWWRRRMGWDALKARGSSANCLSCCSCNISSQRKPDLVGYREIYQGWQGSWGGDLWVLGIGGLLFWAYSWKRKWALAQQLCRRVEILEVRNHVHWWVLLSFLLHNIRP